MISSHVKIPMISVISSLFLKLYLYSLCIIKTSSGLPQKSLAIFGDLRRSSEIFEKCLGTFVWLLGQFCKILGNLQKIIKNAFSSIFI